MMELAVVIIFIVVGFYVDVTQRIDYEARYHPRRTLLFLLGVPCPLGPYHKPPARRLPYTGSGVMSSGGAGGNGTCTTSGGGAGGCSSFNSSGWAR